MPIIFILLLLSALSCGTSTCPDNTALRFGQTNEDYIQLSDDIMDNSTSRFSLCTWIKKRFTGSQYPIVLHNYYNILLGDNGFINGVVDTYLDLRSEYNRTLCTWFHVCLTWSGEDSRFRVYLDGHLIGTSNVTERSELEKGRDMCLGNDAIVVKHREYVFGGDLFKLNIYNRVLTEEEIENMAADMCSSEEENLASITVLSWADILQYNRSGNVSDIAMCNLERAQCKLKEAEKKLVESLNKSSYLEEKLDGVLGTLLRTEQKQEKSEIAIQQLKLKQG